MQTAVQVAEATAAHGGCGSVASITDALEEAKNADPVDEELVATLTEQLATAEEEVLEAEIILAKVSDEAGITDATFESAISDEDIAEAAAEFAESAAADNASMYVEEEVILTGYSIDTFTDEVQAEFVKVVAAIVDQVDAAVVEDDVVVEEVTEYAANAAARGDSESGATATKPIKATFAVYTDQPQAVKTLLRSIDIDAFMHAMQDAGLVDLTDAEVVVEAHVVDADAEDLLTDAETRSAEEAEAAEEFAARRAEDYAAAAANETSADAEEATDATAETTAATTTSSVSSVVMDTAEAATTVEEVQDVAAAAVAAVADAQAAATEAHEALAAAQEALASATCARGDRRRAGCRRGGHRDARGGHRGAGDGAVGGCRHRRLGGGGGGARRSRRARGRPPDTDRNRAGGGGGRVGSCRAGCGEAAADHSRAGAHRGGGCRRGHLGGDGGGEADRHRHLRHRGGADASSRLPRR